jgi:hypothetical protein
MDYGRPYGVDDVQHFESSVLLPIAVDYLLPIHVDAPERIICKNPYSKETVKRDDENHKIGGLLKIIEAVKKLCQIVKVFDLNIFYL